MDLQTPYTRIGIALTGTAFLSALLLAIVNGSAVVGISFPLMLALGAILGPGMGVAYPMSMIGKALYIGSLAASAALIVIGHLKRKYLLGQALVYLGIVFWVLLGFGGLGTGT